MFGIDSKFYEVVSRIADLVVVNLLFVLCSLPIITIGASTTALYGVTKKMAENREGYIFRNYFRLFKENFKQSTIMWSILLLLALIPTIDLYIINSLKKNNSNNSAKRFNACSSACYFVCVFICNGTSKYF